VSKVKIVRFVRNQLLFTAFVCASAYVAYQVLLDDEAKQGLKTLGSTLNGSYQQLTDLVNARIGTIMDEDLVSQNRQKIRDAWADLGY